jgi:hypothetical protein
MLLKRLFRRSHREASLLRHLQQRRQQADGIYERSLEQVRRFEAELRQKKRDYENCSSANQQAIINSQINGLLDDLQFLIERARMTDRYVADIAAAVHKAETIIAARDQNLDGMAVDRLAVELEDAIEKMRDTDAAMGDLRAQLYEPLVRPASSSRLTQVAQHSGQETGQEAAHGLPVDTRRRFEALGIGVE